MRGVTWGGPLHGAHRGDREAHNLMGGPTPAAAHLQGPLGAAMAEALGDGSPALGDVVSYGGKVGLVAVGAVPFAAQDGGGLGAALGVERTVAMERERDLHGKDRWPGGAKATAVPKRGWMMFEACILREGKPEAYRRDALTTAAMLMACDVVFVVTAEGGQRGIGKAARRALADGDDVELDAALWAAHEPAWRLLRDGIALACRGRDDGDAKLAKLCFVHALEEEEKGEGGGDNDEDTDAAVAQALALTAWRARITAFFGDSAHDAVLLPPQHGKHAAVAGASYAGALAQLRTIAADVCSAGNCDAQTATAGECIAQLRDAHRRLTKALARYGL